MTMPIEFGVYAHGGPGVKIAMSQIDDISRRTAGEHSLKMAYDSDSSWPFSWYLRDYPNAALRAHHPDARSAQRARRHRSAQPSWATVRADPGRQVRQVHLSAHLVADGRLQGQERQDPHDGRSHADAVRTGKMRQALWDIWLNRDYKLYDELTKQKHTPDNWPLVHDFRLYVRKDISNQMWDQRIGPAPVAQLPG